MPFASEYLAKHDISSVLEEALNLAVNSKSETPLADIARFLTAKSPVKVTKLQGMEVIDSRGNPTVQVDVYAEELGREVLYARGTAPSGASTGSNEALELRDGDKSRFGGKGTQKAVANVSEKLSGPMFGADPRDQRACDKILCDTDGTELKKNVGGNAITAASFALAEAGARSASVPLYKHFAKAFGKKSSEKLSLPRPMANILNGGKHAGGNLKIQEFMILPREDISFAEQIRQVCEVYHTLGGLLKAKYGLSAKNVGDEGGFAPQLDTAEEALEIIEEAITAAGFTVNEDMFMALDCAASEFYDKETGKYELSVGNFVDSDEMVAFYEQLVEKHPALISIEDGLDEQDYEGWVKLTAAIGEKVMIVGDDLYTTNTTLIKKGIEAKWCNSLLLKVNQIGTISEAMDAAAMLYAEEQAVIVSHRSGETPSSLIADLAVGIGAGYIKTGAPARGERISKYNRLLQIEAELKAADMLA